MSNLLLITFSLLFDYLPLPESPAPEPDDPQDAAVAKQYKKDKRMCQRTAKYWTIIHSRTDCEKRKAFIERKFSDFEGEHRLCVLCAGL